MFGFLRPKLPVSEEMRVWIDNSFARLEELFGSEIFSSARVVLPTTEFFPDGWSGARNDLPELLEQVCGFLHVDPATIELRLFAGSSAQEKALREAVPYFEGGSSGAAGYYTIRQRPMRRAADHYRRLRGNNKSPTAEDEVSSVTRQVVAVDENLLGDFVVLLATLAHELTHVRLLGEGRISPNEPDMEPLTDLCTVFFGLGVFAANAAFQFAQTSNGFAVRRQGYLPEEAFGYALARFADLRGERKPEWTVHLSVNVREFFRRSEAVLQREKAERG